MKQYRAKTLGTLVKNPLFSISSELSCICLTVPYQDSCSTVYERISLFEKKCFTFYKKIFDVCDSI